MTAKPIFVNLTRGFGNVMCATSTGYGDYSRFPKTKIPRLNRKIKTRDLMVLKCLTRV